MVENPVYSVHIFVDIPSSSNDMSSVGEPALFRGAGAVKKIQGAGNGAVNLFRGSREPEPVKTPKNSFQGLFRGIQSRIFT